MKTDLNLPKELLDDISNILANQSNMLPKELNDIVSDVANQAKMCNTLEDRVRLIQESFTKHDNDYSDEIRIAFENEVSRKIQ